MFGYSVEITSHLNDSEYEGGRFGSWSESYSNYFGSIRKGLKDENYFPDVTSALDVKPGEDVYVVWIEVSEGDSFGWGEYRRTDTLAIFDNIGDAKNLKELIDENNYVEGHLNYDSEDGQSLRIYVDWDGYFDRLEHVNIQETVMGREKENVESN